MRFTEWPLTKQISQNLVCITLFYYKYTCRVDMCMNVFAGSFTNRDFCGKFVEGFF